MFDPRDDARERDGREDGSARVYDRRTALVATRQVEVAHQGVTRVVSRRT